MDTIKLKEESWGLMIQGEVSYDPNNLIDIGCFAY